ncbi:hypothetical protein ACO1O0_007706 [Amphichorda felina]
MGKTITFVGASSGCGHSALTTALAAGDTCIALCRVPSKLDDLQSAYPSTLLVKHGNAHDVSSVAACLVHNGRIVDAVSTSIGSTIDPKTLKVADPDVCKRGMATLLDALRQVRRDLGGGAQDGRRGPLLAIVSTTGIADAGRDFPLLLYPLYHYVLAAPHADKKVMERDVAASAERFVLVRPSLLVDKDKDKDHCGVRVGVEDARSGRVESREVGYAISRAAVGRWMYENVLARAGEEQHEFDGKAVSITW